MHAYPCLRFSPDAFLVLVDEGDGALHVASQDEMDRLPTGPDLTTEELEQLEE